MNKAAKQKVIEDEDSQDFGLILTELEKQHLSDLAHSCIFIETKKEHSTLEMIEIIREFGSIKVIKEVLKGFWCIFNDISNDQTIQKVMSQIQKKHARLFASVKSHKEVSKYYLANR